MYVRLSTTLAGVSFAGFMGGLGRRSGGAGFGISAPGFKEETRYQNQNIKHDDKQRKKR